MNITKLRTRVISDVSYLNLLNLSHSWIPNSDSVRPTPETLNRKKLLNVHIDNDWLSITDYILYSVFDQEPKMNLEGKYYIDKNNIGIKSKWIFKPAHFPYGVPANSHHYILWNYYNNFFVETGNDFVSDEHINKIIFDNIIKTNKNVNVNDIEFIWYKNPKPSILDFFHVQVFFKQ